jgi:NAD(P)-dependent dehydrogenase (short-subunit alcohol dehydrogenase family)
MGPKSLVFFITGSSSGIGRAVAQAAARVGHRVFATARDRKSLAALEKPGSLEALPLDVTSPDSIRQAVGEARRRAGRIDVLVNNAGWGQMGAVEDIPAERWQAEFDVNVFGLLNVTREVLPVMRGQKSGTVVNMGSIAGRIAYPFGGAYCASKFAVEAISDALRLEVERFGIRVVLIEPGPINTGYGERVHKEVAPITTNPDSPYREIYDTAYTRFRKESENGALPPEAVAKVVLKAVSAKRPRARYLVTRPAKIFALAKRLLPDRVIDFGMRMKFK